MYKLNSKLKRNIQNKSFMFDGIEEVKLFRLVDADSSFFQTSSGNLNVRFYGINAPETTKKIEPLGKEAKEYAVNKLLNAYSIVIEADGDVPILDDTHNRFLAYVWYKENEDSEYVLYNEQILADGFAFLLLYDNVTKYRDNLVSANDYASKLKLNVYSDNVNDKSFKITTTASIKEIKNKYFDYDDGRTVITKGIISMFVGKSFYFEEHINNEVYGIYVYNTKFDVSKFKVGDEISMHCQVSNDESYGLQLVNIRGLELISSDNKIEVVKIETIEDVLNNVGRIVNIEEIKVFQKANCNKKFNSYYLKVILPFGDSLDVKVFKEALNTPTFASIIQYKYYNVTGGVSIFRNSIKEDKLPWLVLGNDSKKTLVKVL